MSNPNVWAGIVKQIEPDIDILREVIENTLPITVRILTNKPKYTVCITYDIEIPQLFIPNQLIEDAIDWTTDQLESWTDVRRVSYDSWKFKTKRSMKKFLVLFELKWAK